MYYGTLREILKFKGKKKHQKDLKEKKIEMRGQKLSYNI